MTNYYIYTGNTASEALTKANTAISLINQKCQQICNANWVDSAQQLTADPEINEDIYYYGFQAPPEIFKNGSTCDLEIEFQSNWFIMEE